ncbi:hypothetical protein DBV08_10205 [Rhodococcus sp. KBW08]|uniref:hypothetical protein n=1 Tax=Rhodococcus sp. KBW08 TaxID=2144188 RepID=UPI000F59D1C4|nr:hypothetical protein [Rhodococcus sp. KBW08]RQO48902.1 hypothetical protein DBV08_10205 [Rhodococcus sp. KBW08]
MTDPPPRVTELVFAELLVPAHVLGGATGGYRSAVCDAAGEPTNVVDFEPVSRRWRGCSVWGSVAGSRRHTQGTLASVAFACHAVEL